MRKILLLAVSLLAASAQAEESYELEAERVHSDLPLYTFDWEDVWPRGIAGPGIIAGCESRVAFGDWQFVPNPDDEFGDPFWVRVSNYGAFHCAANLQESEEREALGEGRFSRGLFAKIGTARKEGMPWELWVLQQGFSPGSDYMLLAREIGAEGLVESFTVLQRRCPKRNIREATGMDIWGTRYCAINTQSEMLRLAGRMLLEPELGTFSQANEEGPASEETGPASSDL